MQSNDNYSFDDIVDRHNTNSLKWNKYKHQDVIPLWVADTDFKVAPVIQQALEDRIKTWGYLVTPEQMNNTIKWWLTIIKKNMAAM